MSDLFGHEGDAGKPGMPVHGDPSRTSNPTLRQLPIKPHGGVMPRDTRPLAEAMRPKRLEDFMGQEHLVGPNAPLRKMIDSGALPSILLWGPPGSGKTTLAHLIAETVNADFVTLSAVTSGVREIRSVVDQGITNRKFQRRTILFIDEIHRFNKAQQDAFLPHVEAGDIVLFGATTENPSFSIITPLLSRCRVFTLKPLEEKQLFELLSRGLGHLNKVREETAPEVSATPDGLRAIIHQCDGDARRAYGLLEMAAAIRKADKDVRPIDEEAVAALGGRTLVFDKGGDEHYNLISALHKVIRSSDPHATVYWIGRLFAAGEDPMFIARRLIRIASEDVGLADPIALTVCMDAMQAFRMLGTPEGELALVQAAVHLAMAPKSNAVYRAYNEARAEIEKSGSLAVPLSIRNAPTGLMKREGYGAGYTYDHDAPEHFIAKQGLPDALHGRRFYEPTTMGAESRLAERLKELDAARDRLPKK